MIIFSKTLSQERQNVIYFDIVEQITQTNHLKESLTVKSEIFTFGARRLTCQTRWLLFLFQYERVSKPCMINAHSGHNDLFSS